MTKSLSSFAGLGGIVLLLFGLAAYGLTGRFDVWTAVHVAGGAILLIVAIALNLTGFRTTVAARGTREQLQAVAATVLAGGILVAGNIYAVRHPWQYDATEKKIHTLSEQTLSLLRGLAQPVELLAFLQAGDPAREPIEELLDRYRRASSKVSWRIVDPEREPQLADELGVARKGVLVARAGTSHAQTSGDPNAGLTEGSVTNLILKVTRPGPHAIYVLTGHGEPSPEDRQSPGGLALLAEALREQNFEVRKLLLATEPEVPADCSVLVVAGPEKPLLDHEVAALRRYLDRGGRLLVLLEPGELRGLEPLFADYRIAAGDDMIVDREQIPFLGARLGLDPIVDSFPPHAVNRDFDERILLRQARSVDTRSEGGLPAVEVHVVAETRAASWAEKNWTEMLRSGRVSQDPSDRAGPVPVAVAAERRSGPSAAGDPSTDSKAAATARLVVVGDSDWVRNAHLGDFFNREWALNLVEWLSGQEDLIAERPRSFRASRLQMTQADFSHLFRLSVLLLPEVLVILGLGVWWRRRSL
jgi:ABC-type uncharacterized transport system involved in gliding motility auxiliary subunit